MSVIQPRTANMNYVTGNQRKNGKPVAMKEHQMVEHHHLSRVVSDVMRPAPNPNSLNNGAQIKYYLEKDTLRNLSSICLRFQIEMTVAAGDAYTLLL